jgi:hypothetical protein
MVGWSKKLYEWKPTSKRLAEGLKIRRGKRHERIFNGSEDE